MQVATRSNFEPVHSSRRDFLKFMSMLAAGGMSGVYTGSSAENQTKEQASYSVLPFKGDDFTLGHRLRDGQKPKFPDKAERKVDFVIVGGGMAGLACAHYLKDEDYLLLEQYEQTGGTSSGGSYRGIDYSMGAVCTGSHDGIFGQLFDELQIKPTVILPDQIAWRESGHWFRGQQGKDSFYKELNKLTSEMNKLSAAMEKTSKEEREKNSARLNTQTFDKYLQGYDRDFVGLISNICRSFFCAGPDYVTALAGAFMIRALTTNSYVFEGGNSGIARALRRSIGGDKSPRINTSSFVWLVEAKDGGDSASVVYSDKDGAIHRVDCKHVVVSTPPLVTLRIVPQLPEKVREKYSELEYGAFLVANFCMKKKVFDNPYQSFADSAYPFCQMVLAEAPYIQSGKYKSDMGSVLTLYHPYQHGPAGRAQMLVQNKDELASSLTTKLEELIPGFKGSLEQVVLTRWGHAMIIPKPGVSAILTGIQGLDPGWMTLAHSSARGGPSFEGAVLSGRYAADRCLAGKKPG